MTLEIGALRYYHYEEEASKGGGFVGAGTAIPVIDFSISPQWEKDRPAWFTGQPTQYYEIPRRKFVEGSLSCVLYDGIYEDLINLGFDRTVLTAGFDMDKSWAIRESSLNEAREFRGLLSNRMSISAASDASEVIVAHDMLGLEELAASPFSRGALPTGLPFLFQCATVDWFTVDVSNRVMSFDVVIENNLQLNDGPVQCNGYPYYTIGGFRRVTADLTLLFDDTQSRLAFRNQTEGSLEIVLSNASVVPTKVITITIPKFTLDQVPEDLDPEGVSQENVSITGLTDASGDDITVAYSTIP